MNKGPDGPKRPDDPDVRSWDVDEESGKPVGIERQPPVSVRAETMEAARVRSHNTDTKLRSIMVGVLAAIFIGLNVGMGYLIYLAYATDVELLRANMIRPSERVLTEKAFLSLIAATVAQVGFGIAAVVTYLFPRARDGRKISDTA